MGVGGLRYEKKSLGQSMGGSYRATHELETVVIRCQGGVGDSPQLAGVVVEWVMLCCQSVGEGGKEIGEVGENRIEGRVYELGQSEVY